MTTATAQTKDRPTRGRSRSPWGNVRKLPSGRWQVRYRDADGRQVNDSQTYATKREALDRLAQLRTQLRLGGYVDPKAGAVRFGTYAEQWLTTRRVKGRPLSAGTVALYRHQLDRHILPTFGRLELQKISRERVRVWHAGLIGSDGPGASTSAKVYRLVRAILTTAVEDGHLVSNPCQIRGAGQEPAAERPELSLPDALSIAEAVPARWRCAVLTAVWCGLRFGELAALTRADVDTLHGVLHVRASATQVRGYGRVIGRPKSAAGARMVAIPPHLVPELEAHAAAYSAPGATGWFFAGTKGGPLQSANFGAKVWRPALTSLGLTGTHFHDTRATSATLAAVHGATTRELMRRLGHSTPSMAMRYQRASDDRDAALAELMSQRATMATVIPLERGA